MAPRFTIAMPVRNGENYLRQAIDSVLTQSIDDWELVVSDNASTDSTPAILADYASRDARIRILPTDSLIPVTDNFNRAGSEARGEWLMFLCHDDLLMPDALKEADQALKSGADARIGLIGAVPNYLFDNGYIAQPPEDSRPPRRYAGRDFLRRLLSGRAPDSLPGMSNAMVRAQNWRDLGRFDPRFLHCDTFLWHRLLLDSDYLVLPKPMSTIRIHRVQDSVSARRTYRSIREYRKFFPEFIRDHGPELDLSGMARILAKVRFISMAATETVIRLYKRDWPGAWGAAREVPFIWWPILPAFLVRNALSEWRRTRRYRDHVPAEMLYP